jgi:hypothetical protein
MKTIKNGNSDPPRYEASIYRIQPIQHYLQTTEEKHEQQTTGIDCVQLEIPNGYQPCHIIFSVGNNIRFVMGVT